MWKVLKRHHYIKNQDANAEHYGAPRDYKS